MGRRHKSRHHRDEAARDKIAADVILTSSEQGNVAAQDFVAEVGSMLRGAEASRAQARRLRRAAGDAATMGLRPLSAAASASAKASDADADRLEAGVISGVRHSRKHGFRAGSLSQEERKSRRHCPQLASRVVGHNQTKIDALVRQYPPEESVGAAAAILQGDLADTFGFVGLSKLTKSLFSRKKRLQRREKVLEALVQRLPAQIARAQEQGRQGLAAKLQLSLTKSQAALERTRSGLGKLESSRKKLKGAIKNSKVAQAAKETVKAQIVAQVKDTYSPSEQATVFTERMLQDLSSTKAKLSRMFGPQVAQEAEAHALGGRKAKLRSLLVEAFKKHSGAGEEMGYFFEDRAVSYGVTPAVLRRQVKR